MKPLIRFAIAICLLCVSPAFAQDCPFGTCPPPVLQTQQEVSVLNWYSNWTYASGVTKTPALDAELKSYAMRAVRIINGNSCGSGNLVGRDANAIYILTNAHVATNRPGTVVQCEAALKDLSGTQKFRATVIEGAYSSRDTTDWSLLKADPDNMVGIEPLKLSIRKPDHSKPSFTWGCPRCEVPSGQVLKTVVSEGAVWKWLPNSIGGQSGSGVHQRGYQHGLLTWSYSAPGGGVGAGQYTADIYRQSREQSAESDKRPPGLLIPQSCQEPAECVEGYAKAKGERTLASVCTFPQDENQMVESGFLIDGFVGQANAGDYPIWGDPDATQPPPVDPPPVDPQPPTGLTPEQRTKLESAKGLIDEVLKK